MSNNLIEEVRYYLDIASYNIIKSHVGVVNGGKSKRKKSR